jgi:hypothetical protein
MRHSVQHAVSHVVPGGPAILLGLVVIGVVIYLAVTRRRS